MGQLRIAVSGYVRMAFRQIITPYEVSTAEKRPIPLFLCADEKKSVCFLTVWRGNTMHKQTVLCEI
jgi:hypothetical protein